MATRHITRIATIVITLALLASTSAPNATRSSDQSPGAGRSDRYGNLPLTFEANRGQTDSAVEFLARGDGYGLFLTRSEAVLRLRASDQDGRATVLRMRLAGANERPRVTGLDRQPGTSNYYIGN